MNLEFYKNFVAIVEAGGLNKASRLIHVAQPALTRQLQLMEKEYGSPLVDPRKGRHSLKLTEAGWIFYRQAKQILEVDRMTRMEIETLSQGLKGTLRISTTPSFMPLLIDKIIPPFHEKYPDVGFQIKESYYTNLIQEIRQGVSEIGISNAPIPDPTFFQILKTSPSTLVVAGKKGTPVLEENKTVTAKDLLSTPLTVSRSTQELVNQIFRAEGVEPLIMSTVDTRFSAMRFAEKGLSLSVLVWPKYEKAPDSLVVRPLQSPGISSEISFFCLKNHQFSKAMQTFLDDFLLK